MNISPSLNQFKIPMLGKFLGGAMQNTNGQFIVGDVYVITGYNPDNNSVQTTGMTSRNRWIDATAFEVVRNTAWKFEEGHCAPHLEAASDFISDIAKFEDRHDDHVEALSFDHRVWTGIDLANSPDYSVTGRYIGNRWPELPPARPLNADIEKHLNDYCLADVDYSDIEQRAAAAFIHQSPQKETNRDRAEREALRRRGKSGYNFLFATGHVDALRAGAKERRFADFQHMMMSSKEFNSPTADAAEAILKATIAMMGVAPKLLGPNCRCTVLDDVQAGDAVYASQLEDGKPTFSAPFTPCHSDDNTKVNTMLRERLRRVMREATMTAMGAPHQDYNQMVECIQTIGAFVKGCTYRAVTYATAKGMKVEHPHTAVPVPVDPRYFNETHPIPCSVDDRDAPTQPRFEDEQEPSTFVHKSATRKTQEVHKETDATANLRKYRFNPDTL